MEHECLCEMDSKLNCLLAKICLTFKLSQIETYLESHDNF